MLSASRRQPHLLHVSAVDRRQTSMDKSWRCVTLRMASIDRRLNKILAYRLKTTNNVSIWTNYHHSNQLYVHYSFLSCLRPHRAEALSDAFVWRLTSVCLTSVCLPVAYIGPNSRTERPRKTKIGTEVAHVTRDWDTTFKVKRSKVNLLLMS